MAKPTKRLPFIGGCVGWLLLLGSCLLIAFLSLLAFAADANKFGVPKIISDAKLSPVFWLGATAYSIAAFGIAVGFLRCQKWAWYAYGILMLGSIGYDTYDSMTFGRPFAYSSAFWNMLVLVVLMLPSIRFAFFGKARKSRR